MRLFAAHMCQARVRSNVRMYVTYPRRRKLKSEQTLNNVNIRFMCRKNLGENPVLPAGQLEKEKKEKKEGKRAKGGRKRERSFLFKIKFISSS